MIDFWEQAIRPLLEAAAPRQIVEVGVGKGVTTRALLAYAAEHGALVHAVDPRPELDLAELQGEFGATLKVHRERSLAALPGIVDPDVVLLDGDHNWYTVLHELRLLARARRDGGFPLTLLHDVDWPYGRRDLYYEPDEIPEGCRQPFKRAGMAPGKAELVEDGGLNPKFANALYEGGPRNGVRTAVEDFLAETQLKLRSRELHGTHGLGVLADKRALAANRTLKEALRRLGSTELLSDQALRLERLRLEEALRAATAERARVRLERDVHASGEQLRHVQERRELAERQLTASTTARDALGERLVDRERQLKQSIASVEQTVAELRDRTEAAQRADVARDRGAAALDALRAEHERLQAHQAELERDGVVLARERDDLRGDVERLEQAVAEQRARAAAADDQVRDANERLGTATAELARQATALEALADERALLVRRAAEQEAELELAVGSKRRARTTIEQLERAAAERDAELSRLRAQLGARDSAAEQAQLRLELIAGDLERAAASRAWRHGHAVMRLLRRLTFRRAGQTTAIDVALGRVRQAQTELGDMPSPAATAVSSGSGGDDEEPGSQPPRASEPSRAEVLQQARAAADARASAALGERAQLARTTLTGFRDGLQRQWLNDAEQLNASFVEQLRSNGRERPLRVLVGTLASGENELDQCRRSVARQTYPLEHVVLSGLGKKEAVATLMERFLASGADVLLKLDADVVLLDDDYVERVVGVLRANPQLDLLQMALLDYFSGAAMQGVNAYRRSLDWRPERQDSLFTDRTGVDRSKRLVTWAPFLRGAIHAPDPSPLHAYHFGVHRGMKVLQPGREQFDAAQSLEQAVYLERTLEHFRLRRDRRLGLACVGYEQALRGEFELAQLDYTNPAFERAFAEHADKTAAQLEQELRPRRARPVDSGRVERVRRQARPAMWRASAEIGSVLVLLPHLGMYGGVNRFFELARCFGEQGVECVIATPDEAPKKAAAKRLPTSRPDYPTVRTVSYSEALARGWDAVLCGDCTSGVMLTLPLFETRVSAVYLLNGWMRREANLRQVRLVEPDVVIANSSYCARYYADLAPVVIPGGVDLETFGRPSVNGSGLNGAGPHAIEGRPVRIAAYAGRRKAIKRFDDVLAACGVLHERGLPLELHVYDERELELDAPFAVRSRGPLSRDQVRDLLGEVDVFVSAEADAGWSNPTAEAMACGTAVVCTEAGTTDYAVDGETALVVPTGQPDAIAAAIGRLAAEPALRGSLAAAGSERIRGFGWPAVTRRLGDVFADVARDGERRAVLDERARRKVAACLR